MHFRILLVFLALLCGSCASSLKSGSPAREPQMQPFSEINYFNESPEERRVHDYLAPLAGAYQFAGTKGCDKILLQAYQSTSQRTVEVQFGGVKTWAGGAQLFPAKNKIEGRCEFISEFELHCEHRLKLADSRAYKNPEYTMAFKVLKDRAGQLISIELQQDRAPKIDVQCVRPST